MGKRDKRRKAPDASKAKSASKDAQKAAKKSSKLRAKEKERDAAVRARDKKSRGKGSDSDEEEDLEAVLERLREEQEARTRVEVQAHPGPSPRVHASWTANPLNPAELVLFGGEHFDGKHLFVYNDLFVYNTQRNEWRLVSSPNTPGPRSSHQAVATPAGKLFLFGGEFAGRNGNNFHHFRDFWCLDLKTWAWERLEVGRLPTPRSGHRMCLWKQHIVLFGGFNDASASSAPTYFDDLWLFSIPEHRWHKAELPANLPRPQPRSGHQLFPLADGIWLHGGYARVPKHAEQRMREGHTFDDGWALRPLPAPPGTDPTFPAFKWELKVRRAHPDVGIRSGAVMVPFRGDRAAMFGGVRDKEDEEAIEGTCLNDLFVWQPVGNRWYQMRVKTADNKAREARKRAERKAKRKEKKVARGGDGSGSEYDGSDSEPASPMKAEGPSVAEAAAAEDDDEEGWAEWEERIAREEAEREGLAHTNGSLAPDGTASAPATATEGAAAPAEAAAAAQLPSMPEQPLDLPPPRFSAHLAVVKNNLYLFGGILELTTPAGDDMEFALDDMWLLNLDKADGWKCLRRWDDAEAKKAWLGQESDSSESEGEDGEDGEAGGEEAEEDGEEGAGEDDEKGSSDGSGGDSDADASGGAAKAKAEPSAAKPAVVDKELELHAPRYSETLKDYFARTKQFWLQRALASAVETLSLTGEKGLRAGGFEMAKVEWERMQPILEAMKDLLQLDEETAAEVGRGQKAAVGKTGSGRASARK